MPFGNFRQATWKFHSHSTKPVVRVLESLTGGIVTCPLFPSESYLCRVVGKLESIWKLRGELAEKEKAGGASHTSIKKSSI